MNRQTRPPALHCCFKELRNPAALSPHPRNPNRYSDRQIDLLSRIIQHQGWRSPIVVSARSGFIIAGHGRLAAALRLGLGLESVPVDVQDFASEADEWAHLVADNRIAELAKLAEMDRATLGGLLSELGEIEGFQVELAGFTQAEMGRLLGEDAAADRIADDEDSTEAACLHLLSLRKLGFNPTWKLERDHRSGATGNRPPRPIEGIKASKRAKKGKPTGKPVGRPSRYREGFAEQARKLCRLGATDKELADFFGGDEATIGRWKLRHAGFCVSLKEGKSQADAEVADRLFKCATGDSHQDTKFATFEGKITDAQEFTKHYPPDMIAWIFGLKNRRPELWRTRWGSRTPGRMGDRSWENSACLRRTRR